MALQTVRGDVRLNVDELGLEASLQFTPDKANGADWSVEGLSRVLSDARVNGVSTRTLNDALAKFAASAGPLSVVVALGHPPSSPQAEEAEWLDVATPPDFVPLQAACLSAAPPPDLYRVRVETVERTRVVKKRGLLPFIGSREETVSEAEKVEVREPVDVDRKVQRSFWAPADTAVAKLYPPRPGKPGKSVQGKPVPPVVNSDSAFYVGSGLVKVKGELRTTGAGWVRVGARWADLVPFSSHQWVLEKSQDGATFFLDFTPGDKRLPVPSADAVLDQARVQGADMDHLVPPNEVAAALKRSVLSGTALRRFSLSCDRDADIQVAVADDKLTATLTLVKGRGQGKPLDLANVSAALAAQKLRGMDVQKLKADILEFYRGPELELREYPLAKGRPPVKGQDRDLMYRPAFLPDDQALAYLNVIRADPTLARLVPSLGEFPLDGPVSGFRVAVVEKDQELARLSMPSPGQPGMDVFGAAIPAPPGNDPAVRAFENVHAAKDAFLADDDGILVAATMETTECLRVIPYRDARIDVSTSADGMSAFISLEREYGLGRDLNLDAVQAALSAAGVAFGLDLKAVSAALAEAKAGQAVDKRLVASGKEPVPSGGWSLNWITKLATGAAFTRRADGSTDFKNQDRSTIVKEGQAILELLAIGRDGQDGTDVFGKPIKPPRDPMATDPPEWDDTIREERAENGNRMLYAARSGELRFEKNRLSVDSAWKINGDVGPATGNIRFLGPVSVSGNVLSGFSLMANGDVNVALSVEASLVSSDASVRIGEGVKGAHRGTVRARGNIEASFAEQAQIMAVGNITLKNSSLLCVLKSNGKITLLGDRGHLVGGQARAKLGLEVQNLGAENASRTLVSFGQDYLVKDAAEAEERELERAKAMILQADKKMRELERDGSDLSAIRQEKLKLVKLLEARSMRVFQLHEKFEEHYPAEVVVRGTVFPGVVLESHNRYLEIRTKKQRVVFSFDVQSGHISERPLS
ncbi:MAG: DUF342 domain-containing protein [Spirochaetia bacterium]|nr:DUF342 domain-containing protein [Spirochaetia bacterium]